MGKEKRSDGADATSISMVATHCLPDSSLTPSFDQHKSKPVGLSEKDADKLAHESVFSDTDNAGARKRFAALSKPADDGFTHFPKRGRLVALVRRSGVYLSPMTR